MVVEKSATTTRTISAKTTQLQLDNNSVFPRNLMPQ